MANVVSEFLDEPFSQKGRDIKGSAKSTANRAKDYKSALSNTTNTDAFMQDLYNRGLISSPGEEATTGEHIGSAVNNLLSVPKIALGAAVTPVSNTLQVLKDIWQNKPSEIGNILSTPAGKYKQIAKGTAKGDASTQESQGEAPYEPYVFGGKDQGGATTAGLFGINLPENANSVGNIDMPAVPKFDMSTYSSLAENAGTASKEEMQRQNAIAVAGVGLMQENQKLAEAQMLERNNMYNNWLQTSDKAQAGLNELQSKYPVLTRQDIIGNMSTGQKVMTALLTMLGSAGGNVPIQHNAAWNVFNQGLDEQVKKNQMNYERERQNILTTKVFDDDTFRMGEAKINANYTMSQNLLKNGVAIAQAKAGQYSKGEMDAQAALAAGKIKLAADANNFQYQMAIYNQKMMERQFLLQAKLEQDKSFTVAKIPQLGQDKNGNMEIIGYKDLKGFATNMNNKPQIGEKTLTATSRILALNDLKAAIKSQNSSNIKFAMSKVEATGMKDLPQYKNIFTSLFGPDIKASQGAIDNMMQSEADSAETYFGSQMQPKLQKQADAWQP